MLLGLLRAGQGRAAGCLRSLSIPPDCRGLPGTFPQLTCWPESFGLSSRAHAALFINVDFLLLFKKKKRGGGLVVTLVTTSGENCRTVSERQVGAVGVEALVLPS